MPTSTARILKSLSRPIRRIVLGLVLLLPVAGQACTLTRLPKGTSIELPARLVEARVVEVADVPARPRPSSEAHAEAQQGVFEVTRSLLGRIEPGTRLQQVWFPGGCNSTYLTAASRVLIGDHDGKLQILAATRPNERFNVDLYDLLEARPTWGQSAHPSLARVRLGGKMRGTDAEELLAMLPPQSRESCEIVAEGEFALVSCGDPPGGASMRPRWYFERVDAHWVEIGRWPAASSEK